jgi:hypothetical protein
MGNLTNSNDVACHGAYPYCCDEQGGTTAFSRLTLNSHNEQWEEFDNG